MLMRDRLFYSFGIARMEVTLLLNMEFFLGFRNGEA